MSKASPIEILAAASPAAAKGFGDLRQSVAAADLEPATSELVVIAALAARGQLRSMAVHVRRALAAGESPDRIRQAVVVTLGAATLFGEVVAALRAIEEEVEAASSGAASPRGPKSGAAASWTQPGAPQKEVEGPLAGTLYAPEHAESVVFLHSLALDRQVWNPVVDPLASRLAVLTVDLPGHGRSPHAPEPSVEAMADQVAATMERAGLARAAVIGMSFGGSVAQALAIRHPEAVRALGLVDTTAYYGPEGPSSWAQRAAQARDGGMASLTQFQLDRWFSDGFREVRPDLCAAVLDLFAATDLAGYTEACTALGAMDLREALGDVRCPTVVVVGEHDPATPPAHSEEIARRVPGARLAVLPGGKHLTAVERPLAVLAQMTDLLDA